MAIQKKVNEPKEVHVDKFARVAFYLLFIFIIPIFVYIGWVNEIKRIQVKVDEADSGIDVQLTKRKEMLSKLIDASKGAMKFERETLQQITKLRSMKPADLSTEEKADFNKMMDGLQRQINVQLEAYPTLKSQESIHNLQLAISEVEENISAARRIFNSNVSNFNRFILSYPKSIPASNRKISTLIFFEASEAQKEDVNVDLEF